MPSTSNEMAGSGFGFAPILFLSLLVACAARPIYPLPSKVSHSNRLPLQTSRPFNIAHRGSNGEIPEETSAAYMRAIEEGADFIETDILSSKDGVLICFHDVTLDDTTDVADHKEFANRKRTYEVQGVNATGFFTVDFTLKELKKLRLKQRFSFRDQQYNGKFPIITFEEFISIALDASRVVGIYPEIKNPIFINQHVKWPGGKRFEDKFMEILKKYGYKGSYMSEDWLKQPVFIQSFAPTSLVYISNQTDSPKIFLIDDITMPTQDTNQSYWEITSDAYLDYIKDYVVGIGPWKDTIVPVGKNYLQMPTDLVARAHSHDLQVHPYTYRNENKFLHFNFHQDPYEEYDYWLNKIGVDGLFTDFTGSLHNLQEWASPLSKDDSDDNSSSHSYFDFCVFTAILWKTPYEMMKMHDLVDNELRIGNGQEKIETVSNSMAQTQTPKSVIHSLGEEIIRIITPVSICMFMVVILVSILNTESSSSGSSSINTMATIAYNETTSDSFWDKFKGAVLNSLVFVAVITLVTFVLVLLFYLRCTRFLRLYMGFSSFLVLGFMGGEIALFFISDFNVPIDSITFCVILFNFAFVGVLAVFMSKMAIFVTQGYLVVIGVLVAYWFTLLPEWTTWVLLVAMALYDLAAVLLPVGPLRILVELAISRDEDIPALVYEARPVTHGSGSRNGVVRRSVWRERSSIGNRSDENLNSGINSNLNLDSDSVVNSNLTHGTVNSIGSGHNDRILVRAEQEQVLERDAELSAPLIDRRTSVQLRGQETSASSDSLLLEGIGLGSTGAIKLGLGDFIFYSVLVGRAAIRSGSYSDAIGVLSESFASSSSVNCTSDMLKFDTSPQKLAYKLCTAAFEEGICEVLNVLCILDTSDVLPAQTDDYLFLWVSALCVKYEILCKVKNLRIHPSCSGS
ncbi:unnamed protein product [Dovyalis caffra]|uniref:glycerophosphodiester phosphodiesterase n=1 Tax=Dovyalis caffra TaxID=77055 RepID=A0AAV1QNB1_9ROSI|nr:unnamed protein product [Dovyalis caffra]